MASPKEDKPPLSRNEVARILDDIALMLEVTGANPFRSRAFSNAARSLEETTGDLTELVASGELLEVRGIGKGIFGDIQQLLATGTCDLIVELQKQVPPGVLEILHISGMGPKKVKLVHDQLGIDSISALEKAGRAGHLAVIPGFGEKTQTNILRAIARMRKYEARFLYPKALADATVVYDAVCSFPGVKRHLLGGSLRRRKETIGDVDILVSATDAEAIMDVFVALPAVATVVGKGPTKSSVILQSGINVDLRVVQDDQFAFASHYFTGSKSHNTELRARAKRRGLKLNEYGLFDDKETPTPCRDEAALFAALDLDYIAPELRENLGEIDAAAEHRLPALVDDDDIRGVFHCHTTYSDGASTLGEMVDAARALGHQYFGTGDHSQGAVYAEGMTVVRVAEQRREIAALNAELSPFVVFHGVESDIRGDGSLDYPDDILAGFDYVVASIHGQFNMSEKQMTERIVRAMSHPATTMLGHPTGRLLLSREGYPVNLRAVIEAAVEHDVIIEINAHPNRLDLDWRHVKEARDAGVLIAINPDSHHTKGIVDYLYGVGVARKGWLEKKHLLNTRTAAEVRKYFDARKKKKGLA